jgi:hypothetical protein
MLYLAGIGFLLPLLGTSSINEVREYGVGGAAINIAQNVSRWAFGAGFSALTPLTGIALGSWLTRQTGLAALTPLTGITFVAFGSWLTRQTTLTGIASVALA